MPENHDIISVCISTRNRPEGLKRLLNSLARQENAPPFEVVVADNGDSFDAADLVDTFRPGLDILYDKEKRVGVAHVRNLSVAMARGSILAFIDDDEEASPGWLAELHRVMCTYDAAGVIGPVQIRFDQNVAPAVAKCRLFTVKEYPEGEVLPWYHTRTSNALIRKDALPDPGAPFNIAFNDTGGEDIDMFSAIIEAGGKIVAAGGRAAVFEDREEARANFRWVLKRSLRNGGHCADAEWEGLTLTARCKKAWAAGCRALSLSRQAYSMRRGDQDEYVLTSIEASEHFGRALRVTGYLYPEYKKRS